MLREQLDSPFTYKPFHAEKALVFFEDRNQTKLICKNRGWTTMGRFYVKFEKWNQEKYVTPKLVSSYGGWINFRGIPLHAWNLDSFIQIGDVCGGYIDVAREIRDMNEIIEASIRIKDTYTGFIRAFINLFDKKGKNYIVQTLVQAEGK